MLGAMEMQFLQQAAQDPDNANMWAIGEAMGLDRQATETLCLEVMSAGFMEMKNLSGAISFTEAGLAEVGGGSLSAGGMGSSGGKSKLVEELQAAGDLGVSGAAAADMALDISCLAAQLKRSTPLEAVNSACLEAIGAALKSSTSSAAKTLAEKIKQAG